MDCPQCGEKAAEFAEGVCTDCCKANQDTLDTHNAELEAWERLTEKSREDRIRWAMNG